jgi:hypothetical protein
LDQRIQLKFLFSADPGFLDWDSDFGCPSKYYRNGEFVDYWWLVEIID